LIATGFNRRLGLSTRPSHLYDRIVDVMEELMKFTLLTRDRAEYLVDRYSERKESAEALTRRVNLSAATCVSRYARP
jgi:arsenic resistance protein ArsH